MSNKNLSKVEIEKLKGKYYKITVVGSIIGLGGIMFIPAIPLIALVSGIAVGAGYIACKKREKLEIDKEKL